eukprot:434599_1
MYSPTSNTNSNSPSTCSPSYSSTSTDKLNTKYYNSNNGNGKTEQTNFQLKSKPKTLKFKTQLIYEVIAQARVRSGYELTSRYITDLPEGSVLTVEEIRNNRARIIGPIYGWISIISKYGIQIIMPLNKHTAKIGGSVIFTKKIKQINSIQTHYETIHGKIIEYNQKYGMHKIQCKNGTQQWISLKDPNIHYIPKNQSMKLNEIMNSSNVNPVKQAQGFFNQFFISDYPQFANKDTKICAKYKETKTKTKTKTKTHIVTVNNVIKKQCIDEQKSKLSVKLSVNNNKIEMKEYEEFEIEKKRNDYDNNEMKSNINKDKKYICRKSEQEFINKIREIEKKIIDHLHLRGYYENHPDFWRYIAKAKELAIAKAEKERQKLLQRQKLEQQTRNN